MSVCPVSLHFSFNDFIVLLSFNWGILHGNKSWSQLFGLTPVVLMREVKQTMYIKAQFGVVSLLILKFLGLKDMTKIAFA